MNFILTLVRWLLHKTTVTPSTWPSESLRVSRESSSRRGRQRFYASREEPVDVAVREYTRLAREPWRFRDCFISLGRVDTGHQARPPRQGGQDPLARGDLPSQHVRGPRPLENGNVDLFCTVFQFRSFSLFFSVLRPIKEHQIVDHFFPPARTQCL